MGSIEASTLKANYKYLTKSQVNLSNKDFDKFMIRLLYLSSPDLEMRKAINFQKNYIDEMKKYSHFDNYNLLDNKLNSFSNPLQFYKWISKFELAGDLTLQSDQYYAQAHFNGLLAEMGLLEVEWEDEESE